jgi:hypothetical protein
VIDEATFHGEIERAAHDDVRLVHRLGRQPVPVAPARREQLGVEVIEVVRAQVAQRNRPEGREDVVVHDPRVPIRGRRPYCEPLPRQPGVDHEGFEVDRFADPSSDLLELGVDA